MTVLDTYRQKIQDKQLTEDLSQLDVVKKLDQLCSKINNRRFWQRKPRGFYLWGPPGRGKTLVMDLFFSHVKQNKRRVHFHEFMLNIHMSLRNINADDPLAVIVASWAKQIEVLCFDEFFVNDITDAMILKRILELLFEHGILLVVTSNVAPNDLYKNGLQRASFIPAIGIINKNLNVIPVSGDIDHRFEMLANTDLYLLNDASAQKKIQSLFNSMITSSRTSKSSIMINDRHIGTVSVSGSVVWFDFTNLFKTPRSAKDYLEIAIRYQTIFISDVVQMHDDLNDAARRFITAIDAFYDHGVKLILSANVAAEDLYCGRALEFEFRRCVSRLKQMQSHDYLHSQHK